MQTKVSIWVGEREFDAYGAQAIRGDAVTLETSWGDPAALLESLDEQWDSARNSIRGQLIERKQQSDAARSADPIPS